MVSRRIAGLGLVLAVAALVAGCEETAKKQVRVTQPAATPIASITQVESSPLPLATRTITPLEAMPVPGVDALIAHVEAVYQAAEKAYEAGNSDEARRDFNQAIDLITNSGLEARKDPRLSQLFDQIVDAAHSYELEAKDTDDTDTDSDSDEVQPSEPAPIEEIANLNLPAAADPQLAMKAEKELISVPHDLPLTVNDSVLAYLSFFQTDRGRAIVETGLRRAGRYHAMILRVLKEEGLPQDLIYLAQAESAFQPQAVSKAGARGIWQFMPFRGQEYDLERTYYVDERSDPEKATRAAAQHFRDLYQMFGDWYLVMAAYNSGPGNVTKAVERTGYADFWELQKLHALPKETQNYVPIILAMALVAKDPARYGLQVDPEKPPEVDIVKPGHSIDLRLVADAIDVDADDLHQLNPELLRFVTPDDPNFELKVPKGDAAKFESAISAIPPEHWTSWRLHQVEDGDTLASVARHYRVTLASLEDANSMDPHSVLPVGGKIVIPAAPPTVSLLHYRVRTGDTLEGVADRFGVTAADLKRWNGIRGNHVARGMRLRIYGGGVGPSVARAKAKPVQTEARNAGLENVAGSEHSDPAPVQHKVKPGETLYSIARLYRTSVATLRDMNPFLTDRGLEAGDMLTITPAR